MQYGALASYFIASVLFQVNKRCNFSQKLFNKITDSLKNIDDLSPEWVLNGRFCTPRLLFYFDKRPAGVYNLKKVEHNLEDRIYHILKKTRIISNFGYLS